MAFVPSSRGLAWKLRRHRRSGFGPARLLSFERPHGRLERLYAFLVHGGLFRAHLENSRAVRGVLY
jgi:hypothetical protein